MTVTILRVIGALAGLGAVAFVALMHHDIRTGFVRFQRINDRRDARRRQQPERPRR